MIILIIIFKLINAIVILAASAHVRDWLDCLEAVLKQVRIFVGANRIAAHFRPILYVVVVSANLV